MDALGPDDPMAGAFLYGLGSVLARQGHREEALATLRDAIDHHLDAAAIAGMENNSDLKSLHGDPRFRELVSSARQRAAGEQHPK